MVNHPGKPITIYDVAQFVGAAHPLAFTPRNITSGFRVAGIFPLNRDIFRDDEFLSSYVTDRSTSEDTQTPFRDDVRDQEASNNGQPNNTCNTTEPQTNGPPSVSAQLIPSGQRVSQTAQPTSSVSAQLSVSTLNDAKQVPHTSELSMSEVSKDINYATEPSSPVRDRPTVTPDVISPFPKAPNRKQKGGKTKGKTQILTDTPVKLQLQTIIEQRQAKKQKQQKVKRREGKKDESSESEDVTPVKKLCLDSDDNDEDNLPDNQPELEVPDADNLKENNFVLIQFSTKKTLVHYIGQILNKIEGDEAAFEIKFLRREKPKSLTFIFPNVDDISDVDFEDIIARLPDPSHHGGTSRVARHLIFAVDLGLYDKSLR